MQKTTLLILTLFFSLLLTAQNPFKKNDIYLEAGGAGLYGSINYERQLTKTPGVGIRVGLGVYTRHATYLTIPIGVNYLFKLKGENKFIEAGMYVTPAREQSIFYMDEQTHRDEFISFTPSIAYRKHTRHNIMWRLSVAPSINKYGFTSWLGFALGKRF